ncbi:copper chaperone PCu(A)C [Amphritea opalescens]|uniref:Copper chaperone PCu(A)C n=1 Tax=Amphritea opalescens TaxID=2490544 RepID=A0A430KSE9_9GAMM|nr:copper chaperone PCu(A)C [Amphritea opalescens]RTE66264.1 copper chaperone PCu(A)C [Amphritea opalescens]
MKKLLTLVAALTLSASAFAEVTVDQPYARLVPPGQPNSAAFMTLKNNSNEEVSLVSAASSVAKVVELHTHIHDNGVMKMRQVPKITLQPNGEVALKPGGLHIMLIGLEHNLAKDEMIDLTLNFSDGSSEQLDIPVMDVMAGMSNMKMHHDMKKDMPDQ